MSMGVKEDKPNTPKKPFIYYYTIMMVVLMASLALVGCGGGSGDNGDQKLEAKINIEENKARIAEVKSQGEVKDADVSAVIHEVPPEEPADSCEGGCCCGGEEPPAEEEPPQDGE